MTAAICTGPEAHPDPRRRWLTGPAYAACYVVLAAPSAARSWHCSRRFRSRSLATIAGVALLGPLSGALHAAFAKEADRLVSGLTFGVTASGTTLLGIGAPFWGLLAGRGRARDRERDPQAPLRRSPRKPGALR